MTSSSACRINRRLVAWRFLGECALLVNGPRTEVHRLNRAGTGVWRLLTSFTEPVIVELLPSQLPDGTHIARQDLVDFLADLEAHHLLEVVRQAPPSVATPAVVHCGSSPPVRPLRRRINDMAEVVLEIAPTPHVTVRKVGAGYLVQYADGELTVQTKYAAAVWDSVLEGPCTFVDVLDRVCSQFDLNYDDAERVAWPLLVTLLDRDALRGVIRPPSAAAPADRRTATVDGPQTAIDGVRSLGCLASMDLQRHVTIAPRLAAGPVLRDASGLVEHVAIVCQYGVHGVAPGVPAYATRCIAELRGEGVGLVIIAGGGRGGGSGVCEAESVASLYREHLPGVPLWLEQHSKTTWENLKHCLEMLLARSIVPQRISLLGERARAEKLRASCWLARRRFAAFRDVEFRAVGVDRERGTWRDRRAIQAVAGSVLLFQESRTSGPLALSLSTAVSTGTAKGPVLRDVSRAVDHVAIVCQYGINGLTPGVGPYVQRCIDLLRRLDVDLVIIAGGGQHVDADIREAESVAGLYHAHVPLPGLWVESQSATTWENVKNSIEMLAARSIAPRRISVVGDRVRTEKLRVSCWLARQRFAGLRDVDFRVVPVSRQRATWRDRRSVQAVASSALLLRESLVQAQRLAPPS